MTCSCDHDRIRADERRRIAERLTALTDDLQAGGDGDEVLLLSSDLVHRMLGLPDPPLGRPLYARVRAPGGSPDRVRRAVVEALCQAALAGLDLPRIEEIADRLLARFEPAPDAP